MLSKSRGQVLCVAAAFHALFNMSNPTAIPVEISESAIIWAGCNQNAVLADKVFKLYVSK